MRRESNQPALSAVFVDYDNIYLSLKRRNEEAAKRFSKDAGLWLKAIETGELITATNAAPAPIPRRMVMSRCYGNPVPRRNQSDNSTDMSSFPFVRHHFLRGGFEIIDCPPLTAQLKNSSDIRMVMDIRDYITHDTYFDEFVILSGDADFTPLLHRLRAHARRTVIFANDHTAAPYTAICDGEVREADLLKLLLDGKVSATAGANAPLIAATPSSASLEHLRAEIIADVAAQVRSAGAPLPLEVLADRAMRALGHERTVGTNWAGAGGFRELLTQSLPENVRLTESAPYLVYEAAPTQTAHVLTAQSWAGEAGGAEAARYTTRSVAQEPVRAPRPTPRDAMPVERADAAPAHYRAEQQASVTTRQAVTAPGQAYDAPRAPQQTAQSHSRPVTTAQVQQTLARTSPSGTPNAPAVTAGRSTAAAAQSRMPAEPAAEQIKTSEGAAQLQQSIARIHEACQAPPFSPPEYRALFEIMAREISEQNLQGAQTIDNIATQAQQMGLDVRRDDVRFVLEVVSEADPWFEQGATANLFAGRFRNFVVARCRSQGLNLTADELDLIDAWFAGAPDSRQSASRGPSHGRAADQAANQPANRQLSGRGAPVQPTAAPRANDRWWTMEDGRQPAIDPRSPQRPAAAAGSSQSFGEFQPGVEIGGSEDFPRIIKNRLRG